MRLLLKKKKINYAYLMFLLFFGIIDIRKCTVNLYNSLLDVVDVVDNEKIKILYFSIRDFNLKSALILSNKGFINIDTQLGIYYYNKFVDDKDNELTHYLKAKQYFLNVINMKIEKNIFYIYYNFYALQDYLDNETHKVSHNLSFLQQKKIESMLSDDNKKALYIQNCNFNFLYKLQLEYAKRRLLGSDGYTKNILESILILQELGAVEYEEAYPLLALLYKKKEYGVYNVEKSNHWENKINQERDSRYELEKSFYCSDLEMW